MSTRGVVYPGWIAALLALLLAWLHLVFVTLVLGGLVAVAGVTIVARTWARTKTDQLKRSPRERRLVLLATAAIAVAAVGMFVWDSFGAWHSDTVTQWPWRGMVLAFFVGALTVFLSSLVDWSYVVPRLHGSGDLPGLPCLTSTDGRWRAVTRVWLANRITAYVIGRIALVVALLFFIASFHPKLPTGAASALATLLVAVVVYYINQLMPLGALVGNPPIQIGDKIILAEEFGVGIEARPVYYVVDVGIEGVKLLELGADDAPRAMEHVRTHDRSIGLTDIAKLLRTRDRFTGCRFRCSRANSPYCPLELGDPTESLVKSSCFGAEPGAVGGPSAESPA